MATSISVIIPCWNQGRFLRQAVESALAQDHPATQVVVVNDGSTDETATIARAFGGRIVYVEQPNRGAASARNTGIRAAAGAHIAFLDADDFLLPGSLSTRAAFLDTHPSIGFVCGDALPCDEAGTLGPLSIGNRPRHPENFRLDLVQFCALMCTVMVRRHCLERVGGFDEEFNEGAEDWFLWTKVARYYDMTYLTQPFAARRFHATNMTRDRERLLQAHRMAVARLLVSPHFAGYPRPFRARMLFFAVATAWWVQPKRVAVGLFLRGLVTDPRQIPFAARVGAQGVRNSLRRARSRVGRLR